MSNDINSSQITETKTPKNLHVLAYNSVCPVIEVPLTDTSNDDEKGLLTNYFFYFGDGLAVVLGFGSLYNHSYDPNATYVKKPADRTVEFMAINDIGPDEEITVNYNDGNPDDKTPIGRGVPPLEV